MNRFILVAGALVGVLVARDASAQGFVSPFVGTTLSSPTSSGKSTKPGFGVALGGLGQVIGGEVLGEEAGPCGGGDHGGVVG